jgi:cell division protein FtsA
MNKPIYTGIDIGTYHVKVVIAAPSESSDAPMAILGTGIATARGLRHGYIIDSNEAIKSIREALARAQGAAKVQVTRARLAVGGVGLDEVKSSATISLTPWSGTVTDAALERAQRESEKQASSKLVNRTVIHTIPLEYKVDGSPVLGQPVGLQGTKLSVETLIVTLLSQHYDDLVEALESAGIEVDGVMAAPLAASLVTLTKAQKTAGVILANIGAETVSVVVFDNDTPVSVKVFPAGAADITNTIALSFQVPLPEAEQLKRGAVTGSDIPQRKMDTIITGKLKEMFTLVNAHLKSIGRQRLLPAGIVLTGGGSGLASAPQIARLVLKLPSQTGQIALLARASTVDATWAVAAGLCRWAYAEDMTTRTSSFSEIFGGGWDSIKKGIRSLLP